MSDQGWLEVERQWLEVRETVDAVIANLDRLAKRAPLHHPSVKTLDGAPSLPNLADQVVTLVRIRWRALLHAVPARGSAPAPSPPSGWAEAARLARVARARQSGSPLRLAAPPSRWHGLRAS